MANKIKFSTLNTLAASDIDFTNAIIPVVQDGENFKISVDSLSSQEAESAYTTVQSNSGNWSGGVIQGTELSVFNLRSNKQRSFEQGGNRGEGSVDLQTSRETETQVASGENSVIGGGINNQTAGNEDTVAGGKNNSTTDQMGYNNVIGGGENNSIIGYANTIPGGTNNSIQANNAFAYGSNASALHDGVTIFSDSQNSVFETITTDTFNIRAANGLRLVDGNESSGRVLTCLDADGHSKWASLSADEWDSTYTTVGANSATWDTTTVYTVSTLPSAIGAAGARAFVSDSDATHAAGLGTEVDNTGSSVEFVPVYSNGAIWLIG